MSLFVRSARGGCDVVAVVNALVLGAGFGLGLWALAVAMFPARPALRAVLARVTAAPAPPPIVAIGEAGWAARLGRPVVVPLRALGLPGERLTRDLVVVGRPISTHLAEKASFALAGLVAPALLLLGLSVLGLPIGWQFGGSEVRDGVTKLWLDHDRAGFHAVEVELAPTCDVAAAVQVPPAPDEVGMRTYQQPESLDPFVGTRSLQFPGGCIEYRYRFAGGSASALVIEADRALSSVPRTGKSATAVVVPIALALQFVSGVYLTFSQLPEWLQNIASLFPLKWMAQGMRAVFLPEEYATLEQNGEWNLAGVAIALGVWLVVGLVLSRVTFRWIRPSA